MTTVLHFTTAYTTALGSIRQDPHTRHVLCTWDTGAALPKDVIGIRCQGLMDLPVALCNLVCMLYRLRPQYCYAYTPWAGVWLGLLSYLFPFYALSYIEWSLPEAYLRLRDLLPSRWAMMFAQEIIAPSDTVCTELHNIFGLPVSKVHVVRPCLQVPSAEVCQQWRQELRHTYHVGGEPLLGTPVMSDGGLEDVLQAFIRLMPEQPMLKLLLLPNPGVQISAQASALLAQLPAHRWIDFSQVAEPHKAYALARWLVHVPRNPLGFDWPLAMGMAAGVPIISMRGVSDLLVEDHNAFLLWDHTQESIAWGLQCLQVDMIKASSLGYAAHTTARHCFTCRCLPIRQSADIAVPGLLAFWAS